MGGFTNERLIKNMKKYKDIEYIVHTTENLGTFCGYVRLPDKHKHIKNLSKEKCFKLGEKEHCHLDYDSVPVECHGGVTFGKKVTKKDIEKKEFPQGFTEGYWIGWDYTHYNDFTPMLHDSFLSEGRRWTKKEVEEECKNVIDQL